jgi:hypothetical protein
VRLICSIFLICWGIFLNAQCPTLQSVINTGGGELLIEPSGNLITIGTFTGTVDFDPGPNTYTMTAAATHMYIRKLDAQGNFMWAKQVGGNLKISLFDSALDPSGNILITGTYEGTVDFNPETAVYNLTADNDRDIFTLKLKSDGTFWWAASTGGNWQDWGISVTSDNAGNVYTAGYFSQIVDFNPGPGTHTLDAQNGSGYIQKLNSNGSFAWVCQSLGSAIPSCIRGDASGNLYVTGHFNGSACFTSSVSSVCLNTSTVNGTDAFVLKLNSSGTFQWAKQISGVDEQKGLQLCLDPSGNIYSTGVFKGTADFDPGPSTFTLSGGWMDLYVTKFSSSGNFIWAVKADGTSGGSPRSITSDASGVYSCGDFVGTFDFDPGSGTYNLLANSTDGYIWKLNQNGNLVWAAGYGGASYDATGDVHLDGIGNMYAIGGFEGTVDFDCGPGTYTLNSANSSGYILKVGTTVGITENFSSQTEWSLSPNPSKDFFVIENNPACDLKIIDLLGKEIYKQKISSGNQQINISQLPGGVYFVILHEGGVSSGIKKFIKE